LSFLNYHRDQRNQSSRKIPCAGRAAYLTAAAPWRWRGGGVSPRFEIAWGIENFAAGRSVRRSASVISCYHWQI
jgi:hypothetical protein